MPSSQRRDRASHNLDGGLTIDYFAVHRSPDGSVNLPMWRVDQRLARMMEIVWDNFFGLVEDFIMIALHSGSRSTNGACSVTISPSHRSEAPGR
jgi:hypothetical protein